MVVGPIWSRPEHLPLQCAVRHLRFTGPTRFTPRRRSDGLGLFLAGAYHNWLLGVLYTAVSHWKATKQALAVGNVAYGGLYFGGSHIGRVLFWSRRWSWPDPKPARYRGLLQRLQFASLHHGGYFSARCGGFISVYAPAWGHRGRAPADQMVRLRCCGDSHGPRTCIRHPRSDRRTSLV